MTPNKLQRQWERAAQSFAAKDYGMARAFCDSVVAKEFDHAKARWMLSNLDMIAGRYRASIDQASLAASVLTNESPKFRLGLGQALLTVGETEAAARVFRDLSTLSGVDAIFLKDVSVELRALDLHEEALACAARAAVLAAEDPAIHHAHGKALQFCGRFDEAAAAFERAISLRPGHATSHWSLAKLSRPENATARVDRLRRLLQQTPQQSNSFVLFNYALFHELDRLDDTEAAWTALAAGAAGRVRRLPYDAAGESRLVDAIIAATSGRDAHSGWEETADAVAPIFITGLPRTGTTLLGRILGNHQDVASFGELNDFRLQYKWATEHPCPGFLDMRAATLMAVVDAGLLGERYLAKTAWRRGAARFQVDKNQSNFWFGSLMAWALPNARILHLRRDAMDSCFSNLKAVFAQGSYPYSYAFPDLAAHFRNYRRLMRHWKSLTPSAILDVDYDAMVTAPDETARRVLDFCGLAPEEQITDITRNTAPVSTASSVQVRQPIHQRGVGGWKRYARHLAALERLLEGADSL